MLATPAALAATHRAGVIVNDSRHKPQVRCVRFNERSINGVQLLERAGLDADIRQAGLGSEVCSINGQGCSHAKDCFCRYPAFWGYWTRAPEATKWKFSDIGAQLRRVTDGAIDGWVWGRNGGPSPKLESLDAICAAASAPTPLTKSPTAASYGAFAAFVVAIIVAGLLLARRRARRSQ